MRRKWVFWTASTVITVLLLAAQLPRLERFVTFDNRATTTYKVGVPLLVSTWTVWEESGESFNSSFVPGNILVNAVLWILLLVVVWFLTWPRPSRQ